MLQKQNPISHRLAYHLILGAHGGPRSFQSSWRGALHRKIEQIVGQMRGEVLLAGEHGDHLHVLCMLPALESVGRLMRDLQKRLRDWIRETLRIGNFEWRGASGALLVNPSELDRLIRSIAGQGISGAPRRPGAAPVRRVHHRHAPA